MESDAPFRPVQSRPSHLCRTEACRYRAAVRTALRYDRAMNDVPTPTARRPSAQRQRCDSFPFWGPGLVTGAADDDPSGIATYSQVGAQFGYGMALDDAVQLSADGRPSRRSPRASARPRATASPPICAVTIRAGCSTCSSSRSSSPTPSISAPISPRWATPPRFFGPATCSYGPWSLRSLSLFGGSVAQLCALRVDPEMD